MKFRINLSEMLRIVSVEQYEAPKLDVLEIKVEAGFSGSMLEGVGGEKDEIEW